MSCQLSNRNHKFEIALTQMIHHPEYNSTLILRSEIISETTADFPSGLPDLDGYILSHNIHRKLLPRRPGRDGGLEQHCSFYRSRASLESSVHQIDSHVNVVVLTPLVPADGALPYYHPAVSYLAFRYINPPSETPDLPASIRIEAKPFDPPAAVDVSSRLYRTCLALLQTVHTYGWGALVGYKKRVLHDVLVPREEYQDLYLVLRERYKYLVGEWKEVTDPLKHVFEDVGIATFLMLLWKTTYSDHEPQESRQTIKDDLEPWRSWPRPPGGFLDLGCGNGLLTHILASEGYAGQGIDLRARTSWASYSPLTQAALHVHALDPTTTNSADDPFFPPGVFIIANHADELTPWAPVLATLRNASGYLSIPCCAWTFDSKFERSQAPALPSRTFFVAPGSADIGGFASSEQLEAKLNLGSGAGLGSAYSVYRIWLAELSRCCGWEVECEVLRIPSTRNWAIVGRKRCDEGNEREVEEWLGDVLRTTRERGLFKTRKPEGKAKDH